MSISQLKPDSEADSYKQPQSEQLIDVEINEEIKYVINHIINKKQMKHFKETHYLVWWEKFLSEKNTWESINKFIEDDQMKDIDIYENSHNTHE